ncbi:MAG: hypothetical protein RIR51_524 [Bacteroidota bacterium]|jgi:nucleoside-diphosphate kinase
MGNRTFTMIKPDAIIDGYTGPIIEQIEKAGFKIIDLKKVKLSTNQAKQFYAVHEGKEFFERLIAYMTSGEIIPMILEKENAIEDFRKLIGNTNPEKAEEGTIRKRFARSLTSNAIHGSDSDENAKQEASFFF